MSNREAWRLLFPTWGRFFTFAFRTHFPYVALLSAALMSIGKDSNEPLVFFIPAAATLVYLLALIYKMFALRSEIRRDEGFPAQYLAMTDAERRAYFRKRGLKVDLNGLDFST
ncbi:MAG: hypothetical protein NVV62_06095 [Terricaulis sp.]|nr:hypothetical protein [Terricaulis sp.]